MVQLYWNHIVSIVPCITPNIVQPWPWNLGLTEIRGTFIHSVNLDRWGKKQLCHIDSSKIPSHYISVKNCVPLFCFPPLKFQNLVPPFFVVFHWFILFIFPHPKFYKVKKSLILKNLLQLLHFCNYSKQTSVFFYCEHHFLYILSYFLIWNENIKAGSNHLNNNSHNLNNNTNNNCMVSEHSY